MSKAMQGQFYSVYFYSEWKRCGTGWRIVFVISVGRRWVRLRDPFKLIGKRMPRDTWNVIARSAKPVTVKKQRMYRNAHEKARRVAETTGTRVSKIIKSQDDRLMIEAGT